MLENFLLSQGLGGKESPSHDQHEASQAMSTSHGEEGTRAGILLAKTNDNRV